MFRSIKRILNIVLLTNSTPHNNFTSLNKVDFSYGIAPHVTIKLHSLVFQ